MSSQDTLVGSPSGFLMMRSGRALARWRRLGRLCSLLVALLVGEGGHPLDDPEFGAGVEHGQQPFRHGLLLALLGARSFRAFGLLSAAGWGNAWASLALVWMACWPKPRRRRSQYFSSIAVSAGSCTSSLVFDLDFPSADGRLWVSRRHAGLAPWFRTNLLGMICCSTSVGVPILTNCLECRRRVCGAQIPALGPRRSP